MYVVGGVGLQVRKCVPLFRISETAGHIVLKFCALFETLNYALCAGLRKEFLRPKGVFMVLIFEHQFVTILLVSMTPFW